MVFKTSDVQKLFSLLKYCTINLTWKKLNKNTLT